MFCSHNDGYLAYDISEVCGFSQSTVTVKACGEYNMSGVGQTIQSTVPPDLPSVWLPLSPGRDFHPGVWGL